MIPWQVHFIVASCENMINGKAMRPGDVLTAANGKTVEARLLPLPLHMWPPHMSVYSMILLHFTHVRQTPSRTCGKTSSAVYGIPDMGMGMTSGEQHGCRRAADTGGCSVVRTGARESAVRHRHRHVDRCMLL